MRARSELHSKKKWSKTGEDENVHSQMSTVIPFRKYFLQSNPEYLRQMHIKSVKK